MIVRLAEAADAGALADIYRPFVESTPISFEIDAPDEAQMRARIEKTLPHHPWLVAETGGELAGYAYATAHRARLAYQWSVDVSAYVRPEQQRRGVGRQLYESLIRLLVSQGYCNAYAGITLPNPASIALHEAVGFQPFVIYRRVGFKLGLWHDVGWWERPLAPRAPDPSPPRDLTEISVEGSLT